jgi:hypothetical protein
MFVRVAEERSASAGYEGESAPDREALRTLEGLVALRRHLDQVEREALRVARERGATLEAMANALGVSRQAVHSRLKKLGPLLLIVGLNPLLDLAQPACGAF